MKILIFILPIFLFGGINDSYAFKKGYQEGKIIKQMMFGRILSNELINKKCLNAYENQTEKYIKENKETFLKGCKEALSGF